MNIETFVDALWNHTQPGFLTLWNPGSKLSVHCRGSREVKEAAENQGNTGVYLCLAALPPDAPRDTRKRPSDKDELAAIPGFWADLELQGSSDPQKDADGVLKRMPMVPTMTVRTERGVQVLWLFTRPWHFSCRAEQESAHSLSEYWHRRLEHIMTVQGLTGTVGSPLLTQAIRMPGTRKQPDGPEAEMLRVNGPKTNYHEYLITALRTS